MNSRGGRRGRRPAAIPGRPRRASGPNAKRGGKKMPSGSLYIQENGKSKFYPDGGRDRPSLRREAPRPRRSPSPIDDRKPQAIGKHARYYNDTFFLENPALDMEDSDEEDLDNPPPPTPRQAMLRTYLIYIGIACVVVVILVMAIIFPVAFLAGSSIGPTVTGSIALRTNFVAAFDDISSTQYINLKADFESAMNRIFQNSATYTSDFKETSVTNFVAGATTSMTDVVFNLVFNSGVDITRLFRNDVFEFITVETAKPGTSLSALNVMSNSLEITDSCNLYCANGGTLGVINCTCTCASGFSGLACTLVNSG